MACEGCRKDLLGSCRGCNVECSFFALRTNQMSLPRGESLFPMVVFVFTLSPTIALLIPLNPNVSFWLLLSTGIPSTIYLSNSVPVPLRRSLSGEMSDAENVEPAHSDGTDDKTINPRHLKLPRSSGRTCNGVCRPFYPAFHEARSNSYYHRVLAARIRLHGHDGVTNVPVGVVRTHQAQEEEEEEVESSSKSGGNEDGEVAEEADEPKEDLEAKEPDDMKT